MDEISKEDFRPDQVTSFDVHNIFGKYLATIESTPDIPKKIYDSHQDFLKRTWEMKQRDLIQLLAK